MPESGPAPAPREWTFFGSPGYGDRNSYYLTDGPEFKGHVTVVEQASPPSEPPEADVVARIAATINGVLNQADRISPPSEYPGGLDMDAAERVLTDFNLRAVSGFLPEEVPGVAEAVVNAALRAVRDSEKPGDLPDDVHRNTYTADRERGLHVKDLSSEKPGEYPGTDPESTCRRCGGPNVSWCAPSPLWNAVMRGGSIDGPWEFDELICPVCFAALAEERGIASGWRLDATSVHVELEMTTPSGRVWDDSRWLWVWVGPGEYPGGFTEADVEALRSAAENAKSWLVNVVEHAVSPSLLPALDSVTRQLNEALSALAAVEKARGERRG